MIVYILLSDMRWFSLWQVQHLNLGRYVSMLESADVHDDLDVVTEIHTNTGTQ